MTDTVTELTPKFNDDHITLQKTALHYMPKIEIIQGGCKKSGLFYCSHLKKPATDLYNLQFSALEVFLRRCAI